MEFLSEEQVEAEAVNVVSLFGHISKNEMMSDPMANLIQEGEIEDFDLDLSTEDEIQESPRKLVLPEQFPDQAMYTLTEQLQSLKSNLSRIKFYLGDLEDLIPR